MITDRQIDQAYSDFHGVCGGVCEDYFGLLYLEREYEVPRERSVNYVAFGEFVQYQIVRVNKISQVPPPCPSAHSVSLISTSKNCHIILGLMDCSVVMGGRNELGHLCLDTLTTNLTMRVIGARS